MADRETSLERGVLSVKNLCAQPVQLGALSGRVRSTLKCLVPFDAYCLSAADPLTAAVTRSVGDGLAPATARRLFELEHDPREVNPLAQLARGTRPVATVGASTAGRPARSPRMRELFLPRGLAHELRAALRLGDTCWGYLHLYRGAERPDFSGQEVARVEALAPLLADGLRLSSLRGASGEAPDPGVVALGCDGEVKGLNAAGQRWLDAMRGEECGSFPHGLLALLVGRGEASTVMRTAHGAWLRATHARIGRRDVAILTAAEPRAVAPRLFHAFRLTPQEARVASLAMEGLPNARIASALRLGLHTTKDHLKAIYRKLQIDGRSQIAALIASS
jgi:DNA-binding CsgD family transcriptional regulator